MAERMSIDKMVKFASCYVHNAVKISEDMIEELRKEDISYNYFCRKSGQCFAKKHYSNWDFCTFDLKKDEIKESLFQRCKEKYFTK